MVLKIARRGASGYCPENTMAAFDKAVEIDCDTIEFDIHKTKDGHIIVMHDDNVQRTTDGLGNIKDLTLKEIKMFHEPNGESVPTLQGVFDLLKNKKRMMLDIKDQNMEKEVLSLVNDNDLEEYVIIDSDFPDVVKKIKKMNPKIHVYLGGVTKDNYKSAVQEAKIIDAEMIKVENILVNEDLVKEAHNNGIGVYVWGAEETNDIKNMQDLDVDAIVCDFPDKIPEFSF
ncbi:MAG: glycerophosphodiester phosphodiesterase family protein [bacterium]|nr:glycerophosphodiester phosphodiesterase family protein [bacterium]